MILIFDSNTDENTHVMVSSTWVGGGIGELAAANLYHTILNTNPPLLKPFAEAQPQIQSTLRNDSTLGFAVGQSTYATDADRQWFFTTSFRVDMQLIFDPHQLWLDAVSGMNDAGLSIALVYQPIAKGTIFNPSKAGTNSLSLDESDEPLVVCLSNDVKTRI